MKLGDYVLISQANCAMIETNARSTIAVTTAANGKYYELNNNNNEDNIFIIYYFKVLVRLVAMEGKKKIRKIEK